MSEYDNISVQVSKQLLKGIISLFPEVNDEETKVCLLMNPVTANGIANDPEFQYILSDAENVVHGRNILWGMPDNINNYEIVIMDEVKEQGKGMAYVFPDHVISIAVGSFGNGESETEKFFKHTL